MRKLFKHLLVVGVLAVPLAACELEGGEVDDDTFTDTQDDQGNNTDEVEDDTTGPTGPTAVYLEDLVWDGKCRSSSNSNGPDIDAVELQLADLQSSVYLDTVVGDVPEKAGEQLAVANPATCDNNFKNIQAAKGAPDATKLVPAKDTQFVSLHGGWIAGEFENQTFIAVGDTIVVHEVGTNFGGNANSDEMVGLYVMTDLGCAGPTDTTCAFKVGEGAGVANFDITTLPF